MLDADGATTMENLRAELARSKEQARKSDAAALKAAEELKAEPLQASSFKLLEKEDRAVEEDLKKATTEAKDACSAMRAMKEELRQAGDITAGKPFLLRRKFMDRKYA